MTYWAVLFIGAIIGSGFGYWQGRKDGEREMQKRLALIRRYWGKPYA